VGTGRVKWAFLTSLRRDNHRAVEYIGMAIQTPVVLEDTLAAIDLAAVGVGGLVAALNGTDVHRHERS
jgi:hypothetical protein